MTEQTLPTPEAQGEWHRHEWLAVSNAGIALKTWEGTDYHASLSWCSDGNW